MAELSMLNADTLRVVESFEQCTLVAGETITPGQAVRIDTSSGRFTKANAGSAPEARIYGIAVGSHIIPAGYPLTAIRRGVVDGFDLTAAYDAAIYLGNTDGALADAAGTVNVVVGRVLPATAQPIGSDSSKLLLINL